jgi:FMN phosphatase YigB (HAD superfamily)
LTVARRVLSRGAARIRPAAGPRRTHPGHPPPARRVLHRRVLPALLTFLLLVAAAGCRVDGKVAVDLKDDGSGTVVVTVHLDKEAAAQVPHLGDELAVADLEKAGWTVTGPTKGDDGSLTVRASKPFDTPAEGEQVLHEVAGKSGLLTDIDVRSDRSFGRTEQRLAVTVDTTDGLASLGDASLTKLLGKPLGGVLEQVQQRTGTSAAAQATLGVDLKMTGKHESATVPFTAKAPVPVAVSGTLWRAVPLALAGLALVLLVWGLVAFVSWARRRTGTKEAVEEVGAPHEPELLPPAVAAVEEIEQFAAAEESPVVPAEPVEPVVPAETVEPVVPAVPAEPELEEDSAHGSPPLRLVVLDAMGVVFETGRDAERMLADFIVAQGGTASFDAVADRYREACTGRVSVGEFWASLGLDGDPGDLSDRFLARHRVMPGVREFLERMRAGDLPVAVVADDVAEWSRRLRTTFRLDVLTSAWITSGDVGEELPGGALLGRVLQVTGVDAHNTLFLSDQLTTLEAARAFGYAAACFVGEDSAVDRVDGFPVVRSFDELALG